MNKLDTLLLYIVVVAVAVLIFSSPACAQPNHMLDLLWWLRR